VRFLPESANRPDWPRLVSQIVNRLRHEVDDAQVSIASLSAPLSVRTVTSNATATASDFFIMADATAAPLTVTLPPASANVGVVIVVKRINAGLNSVTIDANGAELIEGVLTFVLSALDGVVRLICDGAGWRII